MPQGWRGAVPGGGGLPPLRGASGVRRCPSPDRPPSGVGSQGSATRVSRVRSVRAWGPLSCKKLVQMDLKLKPEFEKRRVRRRPYPAPQEQVEEIERQIQECIDAGLVEEYKQGDYPHHCSPCFLLAKPGSTALRLVVDHAEVNKKTQNHSGSIPNMENTLERIAKCRYKTKMDKRSGFWQVDLTATAQELLAFITPKDRVFKWKVMPFGVANARALFQELMNKILYILRRRPLVQELISRGAEMEAHIDDVSLGTNTKEDHVLLLREFFVVCQENHLRIKLEKCKFMKEEMDYWVSTWGMVGGNQPRLRCSPYRTCRFAMTLRRVYTT